MATKISPPKSKNKKGAPPASQTAPKNLEKKDSGRRVALNFAVSPEFKKEFKGFAVDQEKSMVDLLIECYEFYKSRHNSELR